MNSKPFEFPMELKKTKPARKKWTSYFKPEIRENDLRRNHIYTTERYPSRDYYSGYTSPRQSLGYNKNIDNRNDYDEEEDLGEFFDDIFNNFDEVSHHGPTWESYKF